MTRRSLRTTILPGKSGRTTLRLTKFLALACICLFFTASHAPAQPASGGAAAAVAPSRAGAWKLHAMRGNRPLYRRGSEILVQYQNGANRAVLNTPALAGLIHGTRASRGDIEALFFDEATIAFAVMRDALLATPGVLRVEPNLLFSTQGSPHPMSGVNYSDKLWHLTSTRGHAEFIQRSRAPLPKGKAVRVGVIDTGVDYRHIEFAGRTLPGVNLISHPMPGEDPRSEGDLNGHGTRVAGIIAAADDDSGVLGLNPRAEICSIKTFNRDGDGYLEDIIAGIDWAVSNRMHVLNMSFGTYEYSEMLSDAVVRAQGAGLLLVAAAGNDAAEAAMFPAAFTGVLSVGAYDEGGWTSAFSNWGLGVSFHAPGSRILTTDLSRDGSHRYTVFDGTSAAAAYATGVASLLMERRESADSTADIMKRNVIPHLSDYHARSQPDFWLNGRFIMARLLGEQYPELSIVSFRTNRSIFAHGDDVSITYGVQNTGTLPTVPTQAWLVLREGESSRRIALDGVPHLSPGQRFEAGSVTVASQFVEHAGNSDPDAHRLGAELALDSFPLATHAPRRLLITEEPVSGIRVRALWVSPLDFNDANAERTLYATVENAGRNHADDLLARVYAVAAVHEGVGKVPKIDLGTIPIENLMPGEITRVSLPLTGFEPPEGRVTFWMELEQRGEAVGRYLQGYRYAMASGTAKPEYAQEVHRVIADEAIKLLEAQGIVIPDLQNAQYRGTPSTPNSWPGIGPLPTGGWWNEGYWSNTWLTTDPQGAGFWGLGLSDLTLVDGAHDADGVDIVFGYTLEDLFDSHFWIVDNYDDDGLNSLGTNHHSALSKLRALLYGDGTTNCGGGCPGAGSIADLHLKHGAIDHYLVGHKQAAWWFIGHAVHLIGDLSVPSHVDNENAHGAYGATYHDWMDSGNYSRWNHANALSAGGFVEPYDPANAGDPVRYLAYTTAQLGNAFPWASTIVGTTFGGAGNRTAGGNTPHYDSKMQGLFSTLYFRPIAQWHVNKAEIFDYKWWDYGCDLVDFVGVGEYYEDCYDHDSHVDYDNTDGGGNDSDGDLSSIGFVNYPYAIRAAAGLIYYFAVQTNQITPKTIYVTNTNNSGLGSLRQAIIDAPDGFTIKFAQTLNGGTITLGSQLLIDKPITIDASALTGGLTISGNNLYRVFEIGTGKVVFIKGLTVSAGFADYGGGIRVNGTLNLTNATVSGSQATNQGGAIYNYFGVLNLRGVTLSGNIASSQGGAIWAAGATTLVFNSTIHGNQAGYHAGIANENGSVTVFHSTITENTAVASNSTGGGLSHLQYGSATTRLEDSIVALNNAVTGPDLYNNTGAFTAVGFNLIGKNNTASAEFPQGPLAGTAAAPLNPMLGAFANNGGPTRTRMPLVGSPAIDAAWITYGNVSTDQRGATRPGNYDNDLGAVELPECGNGALRAGESCEDGNAVNGDCCSSACSFEVSGSSCNADQSVCTLDACNGAGACVAGPPQVCDDANVCTNDQCNAATGCVFTNNVAACDDGDACTTADVCGGGICLGGPPPLLPGVSEEMSMTASQLTWPPVPRAATYDVVRGNLGLLGSSSGNLATSTTDCLANDYSMTTLSDGALPSPGNGFFYLMRGANCTGVGTYDTVGSSQPMSRDQEIAAAPITCTWCASDAGNAAGQWTGVVDQFDGAILVDQFLTQASITMCTGIGGVIGTVDYPGYACGGNWVLLSSSGSSLTVEEQLTYGLASCLDLCHIDLTYNAGTGMLDYSIPPGGCASYPSASAEGTLALVP